MVVHLQPDMGKAHIASCLPLTRAVYVGFEYNILIIYIKMDLVKYVQDSFVEKKEYPKFRAGDTITVYYEIREGNKTRTQFFRGVVIQLRGQGVTKTFTIRKMSGTVGVERVFPCNMPAIQKIELNKSGKVRRARIFYLRALTGKKARIKERIVTTK